MAETIILSVEKALNILSILAFNDLDRRGISLKNLSGMINQNNTTVHHILKTMIKCGYAEQNPDGLYITGEKCMELRRLGQILPGGGFYGEVQKRLTDLRGELGEALLFTALLGGKRVKLFSCNSQHPVKLDFSVFESESIYEVVTGRVITAFADPRSLTEIIERNGFPGEKWNNITDSGGLEQTLSGIRRDGYAVDFPHSDAVALAVPVMVQPLGAIGYYSPLYRCGAEQQKIIVERLQEAALHLQAFAEGLTI